MNKKLVEKALRHIPDKIYIDMMFFYHMHRLVNWKNPQTFNEKLQWLKINDRKSVYPRMVDKILAKEYVASIVGESAIIPTIASWNYTDQIKPDDLPGKFVLKCSHDGQSAVICKDKDSFDWDSAKSKLDSHMRFNAYWYGREWPYKNLKPVIFAEEYIESEQGELQDYKIHCFNGKARIILVCSNRFSNTGLCEDFYDCDWNLLDLKRPNHPNAKEYIERPAELNQMIRLAEELSKGIPFLRVDLYDVHGHVYFGECTFYPAAGFEPFADEQWDRVLGEWIELPNKL